MLDVVLNKPCNGATLELLDHHTDDILEFHIEGKLPVSKR